MQSCSAESATLDDAPVPSEILSGSLCQSELLSTAEIGHKLPVAPSPQNNHPRQSGADIVAIALSFFKFSQSESGDAETKKREGGGLRRSR